MLTSLKASKSMPVITLSERSNLLSPRTCLKACAFTFFSPEINYTVCYYKKHKPTLGSKHSKLHAGNGSIIKKWLAW